MKYLDTLVLFLFISIPFIHSQTWQQINGPWTGSFSQLTSDNANPATSFAGGSDGVYRSTYNGLNWLKVSSASGEMIAQANSIPGWIFSPSGKTTDGGTNWTGISIPGGISSYYIRDIEINPNSAGNIFLLTTDILYRSTNVGQNWMISDDSSGDYPYYSEIIKISKNPANIIYTIGDYGYIRKSTDAGITWSIKKYSIQTSVSPNDLVADVDLQNGNILFVGRGNTIYKTTDGGTNWTTSIVGGSYLTSLTINKSNSNIVYVSHENGISKTTNGGTNWVTIYQNNSFESITSLVCLANNNLIKTTLSQGIFLSTDGGLTFRSVGGENLMPVGMRFQNSDNTIITWNGYGVYKSVDAGNNWKLCLAKGTSSNNGLSISPSSNSNWAICQSSNQKYYITSNAGDNWSQLSYAAMNDANEIFYHPANSNYLYLKSYYDIVRTQDNGVNWNLLSSPLPGEALELLTFSPSNQNQMFASANSCLCLVRTDDAGINWYAFSDGIEGADYGTYISDLKFDPQNSNVLYAISGKLFKIILPSTTWSKIYEPTSNSPYSPGKLLIDPSNSQKMYSLYTACSIIGSTNGGVSWGKANLGLQDQYKTVSNAFIGLTGKIYLVTGAGIIYGFPVVTDVYEEYPTSSTVNEYILQQNFPNPANPLTTISYTLPSYSSVCLKVFDALGNEIVNLVNDSQEAGEYSIEFDAKNYASGVYIYRLQANSFVESKKIILMK